MTAAGVLCWLALAWCGDLAEVAKRLQFDSGACSGTAVSRNVVLTATHCLNEPLLEVDGVPVKTLEIVSDGNDHSFVRVDTTFKKWATLGPPPKQGDWIRWIGNPGGEVDMYREGYIVRVRGGNTYIDAPSFGGDSGAGMFNRKGELVGVIKGFVVWMNFTSTMTVTMASEMKFTPEQVAKAVQ